MDSVSIAHKWWYNKRMSIRRNLRILKRKGRLNSRSRILKETVVCLEFITSSPYVKRGISEPRGEGSRSGIPEEWELWRGNGIPSVPWYGPKASRFPYSNSLSMSSMSSSSSSPSTLGLPEEWRYGSENLLRLNKNSMKRHNATTRTARKIYTHLWDACIVFYTEGRLGFPLFFRTHSKDDILERHIHYKQQRARLPPWSQPHRHKSDILAHSTLAQTLSAEIKKQLSQITKTDSFVAELSKHQIPLRIR